MRNESFVGDCGCIRVCFRVPPGSEVDVLSLPPGGGAFFQTRVTYPPPVIFRRALMAQRKYEPGPPMDLANMRRQGVRRAYCLNDACRHQAIIDVFERSWQHTGAMVCVVCATGRADR